MKCFVLFDLKTETVGHQDVGQAKYMSYMPTLEELNKEIERQKEIFVEQNDS
ncbi:hypothetical protein [Fibrobacter sp.]|uniref:hypothetical protein n=1 Tax=Fibrobacter sp. TaxID=35828 RepID=UPI00388DBB72